MRRLLIILTLLIAQPVASQPARQAGPDPAPPPRLEQITSETCLLPGQRLRIIGENLGGPGRHQLLLIMDSQQRVMSAERWGPDVIHIRVPADLQATTPGVAFMLRDLRTGRLLGNRLTASLCPQARTSSPQGTADASTDRRTPASDPAPSTRPPSRLGGTGGNGLTIPPTAPAPAVGAEEPVDFEPGEIIVHSDSMDAARRLASTLERWDYGIKRRRVLSRLDMVVTVIRLPEAVTVPEALQRLRSLDPDLTFDANHRYRPAEAGTSSTPAERPYQAMVRWGEVSGGCGTGIRLGMIDTLIDTGHPWLTNSRIINRSFVPAGMREADKRHGTAVASILVGRAEDDAGPIGLLPGAQLYNAGVFRRRGEAGIDTTAELLVTALDWLMDEQVDAINLSLAGAPNRLLKQAIDQLVKDGRPMVAAVGNDGPGAPPAYPAAWAGVVAVTAVDLRSRVFDSAGRGEHVDLAAPGVDIWAARAGAAGAYHSGTSYAVPYVTAALALLRRQDRQADPGEPLRQLKRRARDLGEPGPDRVFGHGLLQADGACAGATQ